MHYTSGKLDSIHAVAYLTAFDPALIDPFVDAKNPKYIPQQNLKKALESIYNIPVSASWNLIEFNSPGKKFSVLVATEQTENGTHLSVSLNTDGKTSLVFKPAKTPINPVETPL